MEQTVLEVKDVHKSFGDVHVLKGINFDIKRGEIHALVGENGAGKSTIIKIICGVYTKDSGAVFLDGAEQRYMTPKDSMEAGIRVIHQEINMVQTLSVAENIFLGNYPQTKYKTIDWKQLHENALKVLEVLGEPIDVEEKVANLSIANQQMIEIAKAVSVEPKILIMDEPTAALNDQETEKLFQLLESLSKKGVAIIYITHRFPEIYRLADRVTVLRDGESIATLEKKGLNDDILVRLMVGDSKAAKYEKRNVEKGEELFRIEGLTVDGILDHIDLSIHKGELAVVFGLVGAGQTELCRAIFGDLPYSSGKMWLQGEEIHVCNIQDACKCGIGYVSDDRKKEGIIPLMSVQENICISSYPDKLSNRWNFIKFGEARKLARMYYDMLHIKSAGLGQHMDSLSGGNQQKGMICRWLANDVKLLVLNMPTRGVDVGARTEIYRILEQLLEQGVAVLAVSPEMPEVLSIADTVYVMHEGMIMGKVDGDDVTQEKLMKLALGIS